MRYVSPELHILTAQGYDLVAAGDLDQARLVLEDGFAGVDFDGVDATPDVAEAASLYARVLLACGQPRPAGEWAEYAHEIAAELYGPGDARTVRDAATLAAALQRAGSLARAEHLYREVVFRLADRDGPDSSRTLAARADLATVLHARGECDAGREELRSALAAHQRVYGAGDPAGIRMLARLAAMARDCHDTAGAARLFTQARTLCREHLPADHPMTAQVATLAAAPANRDHACGVFAVGGLPPDDRDDLSWWPPEPDAPARPERFPPPRSEPFPPPPAMAAAPPSRPDERSPWAPDAPASAPRNLPAQRRFPPPPPPRRRWRPFVIALVLAALGLALGWLITRVVLDRVSAPPATPPPASAPADSAAGWAGPTAVNLHDGRQSITLTWTYPAGAEGPVLVSGGRSGQDQRAFQTLPAGTSSYTVYGLAERTDYCFTVAVVYSTDTVARAAPVCTGRATGATSAPR